MKNRKKIIGVIALFLIGFITPMYVYYTFYESINTFISLPRVLLVSLIIGIISSLLIFIPRKKREFKDIEHGSTEWGKLNALDDIVDPDLYNNFLLSKHLKVTCDTRKSGLNNHCLVIGGTGTGKSFYFVTPNLMQLQKSVVVADPKGEHYAAKSDMLRENGYEVKVLNVVDFAKSMHFNPLAYYSEPKDIKRLVTLLIDNTNGDSTQHNQTDGFWEKAEKLWLMAVFSYINEECLDDEKNLGSIVSLLDASQAREYNEDFVSATDILFSDLENRNLNSFAARQYKKYKQAAGKTAQSILISLAVRLSDFDIPEIRDVFSFDEFEIEKIGDEKTAVFIIMDDSDQSYNYIAAILIDTILQVLKRHADKQPGQKLKIPVQIWFDEFANIGFFRNIHIMISILRSRGISLVLFLQALSQGKSLYKDNWETIETNCDITVFLGGKGETTQKFVSDVMVGKSTIDTVSTGGSKSGMSIGYNNVNINEQKSGRNLLDMNEVARLDNHECIINVRGHQPFKDEKYKPQEHKNFNLLRKEPKEEEAKRSQFVYVTEFELDLKEAI